MNTLYLKIKDLASQKHVSLAQVERELGFSNGIISTWKSGSASSDKLEKVADYFDVTTDYLLGRVINKNDLSDDENETAEVVAAHIDDDTPEEEREQIINFIENLKKARSNK